MINNLFLPTILFIGLLIAVLYEEGTSIIDYAFDHYHMLCERAPGKLDCRLVKTDL